MTRLLLLLLATLIWGLGFVATRWTLEPYTATWSNSLRYIFAGLISLPFLIPKFKILKNKGIILCSFLLMGGLQFQTMGIELTSLAKSGFLTVFYAVFTPILMLVIYKHKFRKTYWLLVLSSMIGIGMLCELSLEQFNRGDFYILVSALLFSAHILAVDKFAQKHNAILFNFAQCFYMGVIGLAFAYLTQGAPNLEPLSSIPHLGPSAFWGFIILSVFSSIIAFSLQIYAQQGVAPHVASLVFLMESVFAAVFGYIFFQEILSPIAIVGCVMLIISVSLVPKFTKMSKS